MNEKEKWGCKYCGCEKSFNTVQRIKWHQRWCSKKPPRNPMSLKEHIKQIYPHFWLKITKANRRKISTKYFNWLVMQLCEIEGCRNRSTGWGGEKEDGTIRLVCHKHWCEILIKEEVW